MSPILAKTIEIYLPTGDASRVSHARITTEAIRIVYVDRSEIDNQKKDIDRIGCYILFGQEDDGRSSVYIGETESLYIRLLQHKKEKDFWIGAYTIQNHGGTFDKAHLLFLEQLMIEKAKLTDRFYVNNSNGGKSVSIPDSKKNECLVYFETIQTLLKALGFYVFVPEIEPKELAEVPRFYFRNKDNLWDAQGVYVDEKFVVLKGSISRKDPTKHKLKSNDLVFRDRLVREGVIEIQGDKFIFAKDYSFTSPSRAADVVSLGSNSGLLVWKTKDGLSLGEYIQTV